MVYDRVEWERAVIDGLCALLELTNGDAQGLFEAQARTVSQEWKQRALPGIAAKRIAEVSLSPP